ncbi:MAG: hypothetical protein WC505_02430 [Patescibacteria group bacterium]
MKLSTPTKVILIAAVIFITGIAVYNIWDASNDAAVYPDTKRCTYATDCSTYCPAVAHYGCPDKRCTCMWTGMDSLDE